jgi:hypothetical protein
MTIVGGDGARQHGHTFNNTVTPGYFEALRIPLLMGRDFTDRDRRDEAPPKEVEAFRTAVVNKLFVDKFLKTTNPLGARVGFGQDPATQTPIEIVGVVGTSKYIGMKTDAEPQIFFPMMEGEMRYLTAYVRTTAAPEPVIATVRRVMQRIDPALPLIDLVTMEDQVVKSVADDRMVAILATVLASIGTVLCVLGLYGVVAYTVSRRTREVGIRVALGAIGRQIVLLFLREAAVIVAIGVVAAIPLLFIAQRFVQAQLYGIDALNAGTIAFAIILLAAVALAGALVPSAMAARIQPLTALREE